MNVKIVTALLLLGLALPAAAQQNNTRAKRPGRTLSASAPSTSIAISGKATVALGSTSGTLNAETSSSLRASRMQPVNEAEEIESAIKSFAMASDGDLRLGYAITAPSGYYDFDGTTLSWRKPTPTDTHYLAVTVQDAGSQWLLTGCKVSATLTDAKSNSTSVTLVETWDPKFRHYGGNFIAPVGATTATLALKVEPPTVRRRDKTLGAFFTSSTSATLTNVDLTTATFSSNATPAEPEQPVWPTGRRPFAAPTPFGGKR